MAEKQNKVSICFWTHVQNESAIIKKMLESVADYIDYWVIVDNGSEDGTQEIIKSFFNERGISGVLHQSEIGWKGHGVNRQYAWDFLNKTKHNCDLILRVDADEALHVDGDFNWDAINIDDDFDAYDVLFSDGSFCVPRMWLWKSKVDWYWKADLAHETIHKIDNSEIKSKLLPFGFRHYPTGQGVSYQNPTKFVEDVLKLELQTIQRLKDGSTFEKERYHLYYLCKSFLYAGLSVESDWAYSYFPYGKNDIVQFLKKGIYYFSQFIEKTEKIDNPWIVYYGRSKLHKSLGDFDSMVSDLKRSNLLRPDRSEPIHDLFQYFLTRDENIAIHYAYLLKNSRFKVENDPYEVELFKYYQYNYQLKKEIDDFIHRYGSVKFYKKFLSEAIKKI